MRCLFLIFFICFNAACEDDPFYFLNDIYDKENIVENDTRNDVQIEVEINTEKESEDIKIFICDWFKNGYDCVEAEKWEGD